MRRTGSKKIKYRRTPSGKTKRFITRKTGKQPMCATCGAKLPGIPKKTSSKTQRRSERKYPELCTRCARHRIRQDIRKR